MQLALDTSTEWSSIALVDGDIVVGADDTQGRNPGEFVVARIDRLLADAHVARSELDRVVVGVGPGPYTSTRVGVSIARTVGFALDVEVVGVCSLDAIAVEFVETNPDFDGDFLVATDARRREIYWARYSDSGARLAGPTVGKPQDVLAGFDRDVVIGNGLDRYPDIALAGGVRVLPPSHPSARLIASIAATELSAGHAIPTSQPDLTDHDAGASLPFESAQRLFAPFPLYLRRPDAVPSVPVVGMS